jgi:hypothetical protein
MFEHSGPGAGGWRPFMGNHTLANRFRPHQVSNMMKIDDNDQSLVLHHVRGRLTTVKYSVIKDCRFCLGGNGIGAAGSAT